MTPTQQVYNQIAYMVRVTAGEIAVNLRWSRDAVHQAVHELLGENAIDIEMYAGARYYTAT